MNAFWIDATAREIRAVDYSGLADLQRMVGGYIEIAWQWDSGDVMFADEEGLLKEKTAFYTFPGAQHPIAGNGVVVGREVHDGSGETVDTLAPSITIERLREFVRFLTLEQAQAWARGNSSEPAVTFSVNGGPPEVLARMGDLFGERPKSTES